MAAGAQGVCVGGKGRYLHRLTLGWLWLQCMEQTLCSVCWMSRPLVRVRVGEGSGQSYVYARAWHASAQPLPANPTSAGPAWLKTHQGQQWGHHLPSHPRLHAGTAWRPHPRGSVCSSRST